MDAIISIKEGFITKEAFRVYSLCMYNPTWETFYEQANVLIKDTSVSIFGFLENDIIVGLIAVKQFDGENAEIKGIAVDSCSQKKGVGKKLILHVFDELSISVLHAETDDDAISFYKCCGFKTRMYSQKYDSGEYRRYKCVLQRL